MQDIWYSDNRDLIKWGTLFNLAEKFEASQILHVAYFRPGAFEGSSLFQVGNPARVGTLKKLSLPAMR